MKTLKQLLREFWLPFSLAAGWTIYALITDPPPVDLKSLIKTFGPAFFFFSWATGQYIRVRKQSHVESNLQSIQTRLEALLSQIETRTTEIVAQITGGSSFCYVRIFTVDPQTNTAQLLAINGGTHPVFDANARIADLECLERAFASSGAISPFSCDTILRVPVITQGHASTVGQLLLGDGTVRRFNIFWTARNGDCTQLLRLAKINGAWQTAFRVLRGTDILLEELPDGFPRDVLGSDWKDAQTLPEPKEVK